MSIRSVPHNPPLTSSSRARLRAGAVAIIVVLVASVVVYAKLLNRNGDPLSFAYVDGTFVYRLARTFPALNADVDLPAYRAQRILLSALAAPFGAAIPWALIGLNILALGAGTLALALYAVRYTMPALLGLSFGLWIGALFALQLNLTEIVTYALVAWGFLFWQSQRPYLAAAWFGLAVLGKETAILYPLAFLLASWRWPVRQRLWFSALSLGPGMIWQSVLLATFGTTGISHAVQSGAPGDHMRPVVGLLFASMDVPWFYSLQLLTVGVPALAACCTGGVSLWRNRHDPLAWALLLNGLFVLSLPAASTTYMAHSARIGIAVMVALTIAIIHTRRRALALAWVAATLAPLMFFVPDGYF